MRTTKESRRGRRPKRPKIEVDQEGTWAISYGDMVTLLLTFFVLFFSYDKFTEKPMDVTIALQETLAKGKELRTIASVLQDDKKQAQPDTEAKEKLGAKVYPLGQNLLVEFPGVSFFKSGAIDVTPDGQAAIKRFISVYQPYMGRFNLGIRAFTDRKPVRSGVHRYNDNLELSALRSVAIMRVLQVQGVPLAQMKLGGYGELVLSASQLQNLPNEIRKPSSEFDLARTILLVIEPKEDKK